MAKLLVTTIERQSGREKEQSKVGPKGEGAGMTESNHTNLHEKGRGAGRRLGKPSCAAFSNSLTSELAWDCENTSPSRCANSPTWSQCG
jgi:hypothetical protein